jgi:PAS domain S-box-containing protein
VLGLFLFYRAALGMAMDKLHARQRHSEAILDTLPAGVVVVDSTAGTITMANRTAARLLGMPRKQIIGTHFRRFFPRADAADPSAAAARDDRPQHHLQRADGTQVPVYSSQISALIGDRRHMVRIFLDLDEYRRAVAEQIESERLQGAFELAGAVCHELNQPVQSIVGFSELLLMDLGEDHPHLREIQTINAQSLRMGRILKQLQGLTRYATKAYTSDSKIFDLEASTAADNSPEDPDAAGSTPHAASDDQNADSS